MLRLEVVDALDVESFSLFKLGQLLANLVVVGELLQQVVALALHVAQRHLPEKEEEVHFECLLGPRLEPVTLSLIPFTTWFLRMIIISAASKRHNMPGWPH